MFEKRALLTLPLPVGHVFEFLRTRYESRYYREASTATKGYVPSIECLDAEEDKRIEFRARGRDPVLRISVGSWRWGYDFRSLSAGETEIEVWYRYGLFMALCGMGTTGHQAANEITETASALDALSRGYCQQDISVDAGASRD